MKKVILQTSNQKVPIIIGENLINAFNVSRYVSGMDIVIISNIKVAKIYLQKVKKLFKGYRVKTLILPDGEKYKNLNSLVKIYDFLIKNKYDRKLTLVALGGGVIGDLVAFAADTFLRGVSLIQIPTTLLAQVDSSIGGKCGINHSLGKNLIGSCKHPKLILIDSYFLNTLPSREFVAGMSEVIKYALIRNRKFHDYICKYHSEIYRLNTKCLLKIIYTCAQTKAEIVKQDELESGTRALLNFGHTFGHAIEASKKYHGILHGEAISIGMNIASAISADLDYLSHDEYCHIEETLKLLKLPTLLPRGVKSSELIKHINHDKKKIDGKNRLILLKKKGQGFIKEGIETKYLKDISKNFIC